MKDGREVHTVDEYISGFPKEVQEILQNIRQVIKETVPGAEEKISYRMPAYYYKGVLVYFAAYEKHIGFYPIPSGVLAFRDKLAGYKKAKGSVQFPINKPIPYELIREIVRFRAEENQK
ncbi:Uncharacterized conserved protein YdhG, YjbR/CyaY-like superfamily, DUF1801 family [Parasporobacterium paucivorans DSM 15970]|uniref:Uncharacterized conserved protein YdhG, YjbR/CyaY-like superfamily, DUF1801 family n=2 Tax=Parasporobacterium TaxID=115543 RepID=A0A1M6GHU3_9FIRM|nr:Uncharacterized conserved protein YdhG, YjbR/CyaY-like superfamily, DUF1801 family [Parasporobacterium paucivorans DSM 15970]